MNDPLASLLDKREALETALDSIEFWALVFGVFVVIGVAGESVYGVRAWWNNRKLQVVQAEIETLREAENARFNKEAAEARVTAGNAEALAKGYQSQIEAAKAVVATADASSREAVVKVAAAEARSAEAGAKAEGFRLDIAKANERAASANETAERERLARLQLEARLAPRVLTTAQQQSIGAALKAFGPLAAQVFTCSDVAEVGQIGATVAASLVAAGWHVAVAKVLGGGFTVTGIALAIKKDAPLNARKAAERLMAELAKNGISSAIISESIDDVRKAVGATFGSTTENPDLLVLIGNK